MKANEIKVLFIKWLLEKSPESIIGNEVLFSVNQCRADIIQIVNHKIHAYEVKSDNDNLDNINEQMQNYIETFNYTNLIITQKYNIEKIKKINNIIGIYIIDNNMNIKRIRRAKLSTNIKKQNLLNFLYKKDLIKILQQRGLNKLSVYELRAKALKLSIKIIQNEALNLLTNRYSRLIKLFLYDTQGKFITEDDLTSLTNSLLFEKIK